MEVRTKVRVRNALRGGGWSECEAKVDTGAVMLVIPGWLYERHKFPVVRKQLVRYADGRTAQKNVVGGVELEICGRKGVFEAVVERKAEEVLIGAIVLESLDLVVDEKERVVLPNPRSKDIPMVEIE